VISCGDKYFRDAESQSLMPISVTAEDQPSVGANFTSSCLGLPLSSIQLEVEAGIVTKPCFFSNLEIESSWLVTILFSLKDDRTGRSVQIVQALTLTVDRSVDRKINVNVGG
jgi:hypothetical protein